MGSKNAKAKTRTTETKVKHRGQRVIQIVKFDAVKANALFADYQKNGFKHSFNEVMNEMQHYCRDRFCDIEENSIPYSLNQFKASVGRLMESNN